MMTEQKLPFEEEIQNILVDYKSGYLTVAQASYNIHAHIERDYVERSKLRERKIAREKELDELVVNEFRGFNTSQAQSSMAARLDEINLILGEEFDKTVGKSE